MYPAGRPEGGAAFAGHAGSFGVRARTCRRRGVVGRVDADCDEVGRLC